ncbi:hypothetical protein B0J11DRAFT_192409 [Dendryphion nanum]|uniref:Myb-like domain-containing protein n=1 Tax=Dendryphion nanum TaxID=256645 RepID=A0A9P9D1Z8_9PLEO|nr:hypothetical protein B0J11DRAFT_192409 [Dendryphion nanum]
MEIETADGLHVGSLLEKSEHNQRSQERPDNGETNHVTPISKMDVGMNMDMDALLYGSRGFPFIVDDDGADNCSSRLLNDHDHGYGMAVGNGEDHSGQHGDLDAAGIQAVSAEDMNCIQHEDLPPEDDTHSGDFGVANGPPATHKRVRQSSTAATTPTEVAGLAPELELESPRPAKRQRTSHILDPVSPPESAQPTAIDEPSPDLLDSNKRGVAAETSDLHLTDLLDEESGGGGAHDWEVGEPLLQALRQPSSPLGTDNQSIGPDANRQGDTSNLESEGVNEPYENDVSRVESVSHRLSVIPSQQPKLSNNPVGKRGRNPSQVTHRRMASTTTPGRVSSHESRQLCGTGTHRVTRSGRPQTSVRTRARGEPNADHRPNINIPYQIVDVTLHPIPKSSSILTAIVHCSESKLLPDLAACSPSILGDKSQVIRAIQLSPDSWLLLGYRNNDDTPGLTTRESLGGHEEGQKSYSRIDSANDDSDHIDDGESESEEDESEGDIRCRKRTNVPWSELDDLQLKGYVRMAMKWEEIARQFPARTPGAVQQRLYALKRKNPSRR